jgi:hypothetical protein
MAERRKSSVDQSEIKAPVVIKFCTMGVVTSPTWQPGHLVVERGYLRIYDSEKGYETHPHEFLFEAPMTKEFNSSAWKRREYAEVSTEKKDFFAFYIETDGFMGKTRLIKIGCDDMDLMERIIRCIEYNTKNLTV